MNLMKEVVLFHKEMYMKIIDRILKDIDSGRLPSHADSGRLHKHNSIPKGPLLRSKYPETLDCKSCMEKTPKLFVVCMLDYLNVLFTHGGTPPRHRCDRVKEEILFRKFDSGIYVNYNHRQEMVWERLTRYINKKEEK